MPKKTKKKNLSPIKGMRVWESSAKRLSAYVSYHGTRHVVQDGDRVYTSLRGTTVSFVFEHEGMLYLEDYTPLNVAQLYGKCPHPVTFAYQPQQGPYSELEAALGRFQQQCFAAQHTLIRLGVQRELEVVV